MKTLRLFHEDEHAIYVHAGLPFEGERWLHPSEVKDPRPLLWQRSRTFYQSYAGKRVVFGHTPVKRLPAGAVDLHPERPARRLPHGGLAGIDTGAGMGGFLSAIELPGCRVYRLALRRGAPGRGAPERVSRENCRWPRMARMGATTARRAVPEGEARFRALFETMTEGVALHRLLLDEQGEPADYVLTDANPAYEAHTGIRREDAVGRRASELYGAGGAPYLDVFGRVAITGEPARMEVYFEPLGRHFRVLVFSPARGEFATVFEDVTATKEMEAALTASNAALVARNEELDAYAHTVAHDLKNPVSAILGFAEHLEQGSATLPEAERRESLEAITRSAQKMQAIIDALLLIGETRRSDVANGAPRPGPIAGESLAGPRARGEAPRRRGPPPAAPGPRRWATPRGSSRSSRTTSATR